MSETIHVGISTCPNDTFAFHGLLTGAIEADGLTFDFTLADVEELNQGLIEGRFDVAKASFHAALLLTDETVVLAAGSALGFGVGPLLLASPAYATRLTTSGLALTGLVGAGLTGTGPERSHVTNTREPNTGEVRTGETDTGGTALDAQAALGPPMTLLHGTRALAPGALTTATMLLKLFAQTEDGEPIEPEQTLFSDIMPRLADGSADVGVCIHEGRFTWRQSGLACLADLGTLWERQTGHPLPLGGILGRRRLGAERLGRIHDAIARSIAYGQAHRDETVATMRQHAQEFSSEVCFAHVDLYVNDWTRDLGPVGRAALACLGEQAARCGLISSDAAPLTVFPDV